MSQMWALMTGSALCKVPQDLSQDVTLFIFSPQLPIMAVSSPLPAAPSPGMRLVNNFHTEMKTQ